MEQLTDPNLPGFGSTRYPGGRIEDGETAEQAAVRELREELGTKVVTDDLVPLLETCSDQWGTGPVLRLSNHNIQPGDYQPPGQSLTRLVFDSYLCDCEGGSVGDEIQCQSCGKESMR
jgi:hypothetical protein